MSRGCMAGAGNDMGVASRGNPVRMAVAVWAWGNYYGDAKMKGAKLDIANGAVQTRNRPITSQGSRPIYDRNHVQACRRRQRMF